MNAIASVEAESHSKAMAQRRTGFGHGGVEQRIRRIESKIGTVSMAAENVAYGKMTARQVVKGWINSARHRANIEGRFSQTGIGVARNSKGVLYYTQIFIQK